jgi:hypothetical protein
MPALLDGCQNHRCAVQSGYGKLTVMLFGIFPMARFKGPALDKGEIMRGLAEMPWRPGGFREQPSLTTRSRYQRSGSPSHTGQRHRRDALVGGLRRLKGIQRHLGAVVGRGHLAFARRRIPLLESTGCRVPVDLVPIDHKQRPGDVHVETRCQSEVGVKELPA